jgi:FAD:protein FMN transferase
VGWKKLRVQADALYLQDGAALTFNGIAQGYAADRVMNVVQGAGALSARVDTGEVGRFHADGDLLVKHPRHNTTLGALDLSSGFVAVSGDYANSFSADFVHHHILDPKRGFSPRELASVVVVAPSGAYADGLATAFMVMGVAASLECLRKLQDCSAVFIDKAGAVTLSPGMQGVFHHT